MAELAFFSGTMDCGKSTLALQMDYNHRRRGRRGLTFTRHDRAGGGLLSSRLGLQVGAREVGAEMDFWDVLVGVQTEGGRVDYLVCDEAQFYTAAQVEQLARIVDEMEIDVFAFGITSDFRTELFPGSKRLIELADRVEVLQVQALCWCGRRATTNARVVNGVMVTEGEQVVVGDVAGADAGTGSGSGEVVETVQYEVLCRRHYMRRMTSHAAAAAAISPEVLPFDVEVCPLPPL